MRCAFHRVEKIEDFKQGVSRIHVTIRQATALDYDI